MNKKVLAGTIVLIAVVAVLAAFPIFKMGPFHIPPTLQVDDTSYEGESIKISGKTDPGVAVLVESVRIEVRPDGKFSTSITGSNNRIISIVAIDKDGARTSKDLNITPPQRAVVKANPVVPIETVKTTAPNTSPASNSTAAPPSTIISAPPADTTPPPLTVIVPILTNNARINVGGITDGNLLVTINGMKVRAGADGRFSTTIVLNSEGSNLITFTAVDAAGNTTTRQSSIILDTTPPVLSVLLAGGQQNVPAITNKTALALQGSTEAGAQLTVNGQVVSVGADGKFAYNWALEKEGENNLGFVVSDIAGNTISLNKATVRDTVVPLAPIVNLPVYTTDPALVNVGISVEQMSFLKLSVTKNNDSTPYINAQSYGQISSGVLTIKLDRLLNLVVGSPQASFTITFKSVDLAGNESSVTRSVSYEPLSTTALPLTVNRPVLNPGGSAYISGVTLTGASITITRDPGTTGETIYAPLTAASDGKFALTMTDLTVGGHLVRILASAGGKLATQDVQFNYSYNPIVVQMGSAMPVGGSQQNTVEVVPGQVSLDISPGTFPAGASVRAAILDPNSVLSPTNNLQLAGQLYDFSATTTFNKPVSVTFKYNPSQLNGMDETKLGVYYFNPQTLNWELVPGAIVDTVKHTVTVQLQHFSPYALMGSPLPGTPKQFAKDGSIQFPDGIYLPNPSDPSQYRIHSNYTANTDACASCHLTHTGNGPELLQWPSSFDTCTSCHDGTITTTYNVLAGSYIPIDSSTSKPTAGGLFGYSVGDASTNKLVSVADNTGGAANQYLSRHHVEQPDVLLSAAPGGKESPGSDGNGSGTWTGVLGCEGCHDPHGNGANARILNPDPNGIATQKYQDRLTAIQPYTLVPVNAGDLTQGFTITDPDSGNLARILIDPARADMIKFSRNGTTLLTLSELSITLSSGHSVIKISGATAGDTYAGYAVLGIAVDMDVTGYLTSAETITYREGINRFCKACHTDYDTTIVVNPAQTANGIYTSKMRHQVGNILIDVPAGIKVEVDKNNKPRLVCLSCHVSHGVNADYWQRTLIDIEKLPKWNSSMLVESAGSSKLKRMPDMGLCESCHQKGLAAYSPY